MVGCLVVIPRLLLLHFHKPCCAATDRHGQYNSREITTYTTTYTGLEETLSMGHACSYCFPLFNEPGPREQWILALDFTCVCYPDR